MTGDALTGGFADAPVQAARAFRAALEAMARPGRIETVEGAEAPGISTAAAVLLLTLCDRETPIHLASGCDGEALKRWIAFHIGAPVVVAEEAMFALGGWEALKPLDRYRIGTAEYPDRSVTLIVEVAALESAGMKLTGPGIATEAALSLPEVEAFAHNARRFPLGWDCYFTAQDRLAALPRTTTVEAL
ncbi:phosphonate C-P lyase system protein PhnH [Yangia mangrovi]|uniref:Phosphonate C-P lyase system protein PhnH n=2 Tax=Alloyangia mangrovi TaxID=1779329 RepID=A0ABT2KJB7_9RHOB|nr:phosphonate C-P lyase system protein PhnH [Alloyangia mangrovi]